MQVSTDGGTTPLWTANGKEIVYAGLNQRESDDRRAAGHLRRELFSTNSAEGSVVETAVSRGPAFESLAAAFGIAVLLLGRALAGPGA